MARNSNGWGIHQIDDQYTRRYNAKQESINLARQNAVKAAAAQRNAQRVSQERAKLGAAASGAAASMRAGKAATNSSRLLAEFEAERSQRRALDVRRGDQAIGQMQAGFGAAGVGSIGASMETARQSALSRNISESQLNTRKEGILQQGSSGITSALASAVQAQASLDASKIQSRVSTASTASINPFKPSEVARQIGSVPQFLRGF